MFDVFLVDDEPAALEYIKQIIDKKCTQFQVVGTARSGEKALELLKEVHADILITDIKMAGISGLDLIEKLRSINLQMQILIISGYSDFAYAKQALQNKVNDYILKPVDSIEFVEIMQKQEHILRTMLYNRQTHLLQAICRGNEISQKELELCFKEDNYYAFLIRRNNLPHRFENKREADCCPDPLGPIIEYGRDKDECFYLIPAVCLNGTDDFQEMIRRTKKKFTIDKGFTTVAASKRSFPIRELKNIVEQLYEILQKNLVCGYEQTLYIGMPMKGFRLEKDDKGRLKRIEYFINCKDVHNAKQEIKSMFVVLEQKKVPLIQVENISRQICNFKWLRRENGNYNGSAEYLLEDLFYSSVNMAELCMGITDLLFGNDEISVSAADTPEYFDKICRYLEEHLEEPVTLGSLAKSFGISQSHLSHLFRKYADQTFGTYFTTLRMEAAKKILDHNPEIMIRDVSRLIGYQDQLYFSRVFKMYIGMSPTEYLNKRGK